MSDNTQRKRNRSQISPDIRRNKENKHRVIDMHAGESTSVPPLLVTHPCPEIHVGMQMQDEGNTIDLQRIIEIKLTEHFQDGTEENKKMIKTIISIIGVLNQLSEENHVKRHQRDSAMITMLRNENVELKRQISALNDRVVNQEIYSRRNNLIINGIPELTNEGVWFEKYTEKMLPGLIIDDSDYIIHRMGKKPAGTRPGTRPRTVIIQFLRNDQRNAVWQSRLE